MPKNNLRRLGDYIREVDVRNRDLKVTKLVGLIIDKAFIPSVANVIGTDLSNYKVMRRNQFACSLMQVSRDGKMPVAMFIVAWKNETENFDFLVGRKTKFNSKESKNGQDTKTGKQQDGHQ